MRALRDTMDAKDVATKSAAIERRVLELPQVRDASSIFIYVSIGNEVHTHGLIRDFLDQGKTVCAPVIERPAEGKRGKMYACRIHDLADLRPDPAMYGALSPMHPSPHKGAIDLCIMPGVAFTINGDRLGMGAAYYDEYLAAHQGMPTIALAYDWQVIDVLPVDEHDQRVDCISTEQRIIDAP